MDSNDMEQVFVSREFHWAVPATDKYYYFSDIFTISLDEIHTKWQIVLYYESKRFFANLHKVEASSDDYFVTLEFNNSKNAKTYDGHNFEISWIPVLMTGFNITVTISLERQPDAADDVDPAIYFKNYEKLFNSETLSDFNFICSDDKEIPAHRFVLVAHSPVMYKMLMAPMIESKTHTAKLDDIDGETMLEVLRFLYLKRVENVEKLASSLLYCAEKYELDDLKSFVTRSMIQMINTDNVLEYFTLADDYDANDLLKSCLYFIKRNYFDLSEHEDWKNIDFKMKTLFEIIANDTVEYRASVLKTLCAKKPSELPEGYIKFP